MTTLCACVIVEAPRDGRGNRVRVDPPARNVLTELG